MPPRRQSSRYRPGRVAALRLALCILTSTNAVAQPPADIDTREIYSAASPAWLRAVGQLQVPGQRYRDGMPRHLLEDCSATLVAASPGRAADTIITAWHCLENYKDLSKPIRFTLPADPQAQVREAYRLEDGGGMYADWAILRLREPIAARELPALPVHPDRADPGLRISMAGFSRDAGKGAGGSQLTFDPACRITAQQLAVTESDCRAYRGASGGAVVQLSATGTALFSGVISEGDGAGISRFVPVAAFRGALNRHLNLGTVAAAAEVLPHALRPGPGPVRPASAAR